MQADEYDSCFLGLSPCIAVVTNVEWDHVDIFEDEVSNLNFLFLRIIISSSVNKLKFFVNHILTLYSLGITYLHSISHYN